MARCLHPTGLQLSPAVTDPWGLLATWLLPLQPAPAAAPCTAPMPSVVMLVPVMPKPPGSLLRCPVPDASHPAVRLLLPPPALWLLLPLPLLLLRCTKPPAWTAVCSGELHKACWRASTLPACGRRPSADSNVGVRVEAERRLKCWGACGGRAQTQMLG